MICPSGRFVAAMITDFAEDDCAAVGKEKASTPWRRAMFRAMQTCGRLMSSDVRLLGYLGPAPQIVRGPKVPTAQVKRHAITRTTPPRCRVEPLVRIPDRFSQHGIKLALAKFLGLFPH